MKVIVTSHDYNLQPTYTREFRSLAAAKRYISGVRRIGDFFVIQGADFLLHAHGYEGRRDEYDRRHGLRGAARIRYSDQTEWAREHGLLGA